jgi:hypothetical protein
MNPTTEPIAYQDVMDGFDKVTALRNRADAAARVAAQDLLRSYDKSLPGYLRDSLRRSAHSAAQWYADHTAAANTLAAELHARLEAGKVLS